MANGILDFLRGPEISQGLLNNPLINLGVGILAGSGPSLKPVSAGQAIASGFQFANRQQTEALKNDLIRSRLTEVQRQREAAQALPGLLQTLGLDDRMSGLLGALGQLAPEAAVKGAIGLMQPPQPTNLQREFEFLTSIGIPQDKAIEALRRGTVVNVGKPSPLDVPIPIPQLGNVRLPGGQTVPIGTTPRQALAAGATVQSQTEQKAITDAEQALGVLDEIRALALGTPDQPGLFAGIQGGLEGLTGRLDKAFQFGWDLLLQGDSRASTYSSLVEGGISQLAKRLGQVGALSDQDVDRALKLVPRLLPLPDTESVARDELDQLYRILTRGLSNYAKILNGSGPINANDLPRPQTIEDLNAIPSGQLYFDDAGNIRRRQ